MKKLNFTNSSAVDEQGLQAYFMPFEMGKESIGTMEFLMDKAQDQLRQDRPGNIFTCLAAENPLISYDYIEHQR